MKTNINEIYKMLDWNNDAIIQKKGIETVKGITNLELFLQPTTEKYNKNIWENCAKIIYNCTDEVIQPYLRQMIEWLKDLNWPGSLIIADRLNKYENKKELKELVEKIKNKNKDDTVWIENIEHQINC